MDHAILPALRGDLAYPCFAQVLPRGFLASFDGRRH
jgi:hypothetical protein